jgi:hypothetical protein
MHLQNEATCGCTVRLREFELLLLRHAGFPSVGKSTLLTKLTGTFSEVRHSSSSSSSTAAAEHEPKPNADHHRTAQHKAAAQQSPNNHSMGVCLPQLHAGS